MQSLREFPIAKLLNSLHPRLVDIGARGGLDEDLLPIAWACSVFGFEPEPAEAERLRSRSDDRWRNVHILPYAVGASIGKSTLYLPSSSQGASLLRHNPTMLENFGFENLHIVRDEIQVDTMTLDALRASDKLPKIDYMKIDIEGAELDVLKAGRSILEHCSALKIECSFLQQRMAQPLVWDVVPFMLQAGFDVVDIHDIHRWRRRNLPAHPYVTGFKMPYSRGQLAQCDLIFLRKAEGVQDPDRRAMLVVMSAALGYFDRAIGLLRDLPEIATQVRDEHGVDLETELSRWSSMSGKDALRGAIRGQLRSLVPQLRSLAGLLPYNEPRTPY